MTSAERLEHSTNALPDWRDAAAYEPLKDIAPGLLAWEWLRRRNDYRLAAAAAPPVGNGAQAVMLAGDPAAHRWNLHRFENPKLSAREARPVWRGLRSTPVPVAEAEASLSDGTEFELARVLPFATLVFERDLQRLLLSDGRSIIRLDVAGAALPDGPVHLHYRFSGVDGAKTSARLAASLQRLMLTGRFPDPVRRPLIKSTRRILLLRTSDALEAGASQREIAAEIMRKGSLGSSWRHDDPSLRSQVQRLVRGARRLVNEELWDLVQQQLR
jgi:hypothetical protein